MRILRLLLLGAPLACAGIPPAAPQDSRPREVADLLNDLSTGNAEAAAAKLESGAIRKALLADDRDLASLCLEASNKSRRLALGSPAAAVRVTTALVVLTADSEASLPEEKRGRRRSPFLALLADARVKRLLKMGVTPEPFVRSAEGFERLYTPAAEGRPATGSPADLLRAAQALAEGAAVAGDGGGALWERALARVASLREIPGPAPGIQEGIGRLLLDRVGWGVASRERGVEARFDGLLAFLEDARGKAPEDLALATLFNDAVTAAGAAGIRRRGLEYESELAVPHLGIEVRVLRSARWSAGDPNDPQVIQYDGDHCPIRCIEVLGYAWDQTYDLPDGSRIKGESLRDLATKWFEVEKGKLTQVQVRRPLGQGRLENCNMGLTFEFQGTDARGGVSGRREWFFKSREGHSMTFRVILSWSRRDLPPDPELDFVLDSIRERK